MQKCKYYNYCQAACTLMIDDLAGIAVTNDGELHPWNDWGYGLNIKNSLYNYFEKNFLEKYPEIRGTIFFATKTYESQNENCGYKIKKRGVNDELKEFISNIASKFELAFHGTTHGKYIEASNPELRNNYIQEFEYISSENIDNLRNEVANIESILNIKFTGGKYCGYKKNEYADKIIEKLGFKWWASSSAMINKKDTKNWHSYFGEKVPVLNFPTNVSGDFFKRNLNIEYQKNTFLKMLKAPFDEFKREAYLQYLYENGLIISIQEHFQNQRTDGRRQQPNVYDDIDSLDKIFGIMRGNDIWYATCSEIANYLECYDNSVVTQLNGNTFKISYGGRWPNFLISIKSKKRKLKNEYGQIFDGIYKKGEWIYNLSNEGVYSEL